MNSVPSSPAPAPLLYDAVALECAFACSPSSLPKHSFHFAEKSCSGLSPRFSFLRSFSRRPLFAQQASFQTTLGGSQILGFRNATDQLLLEQRFLRVPEPYLAEQHLKTLTAAPHMAGTPEDRKTAEYVAQKFREAGLDTRIDEYKVWMNYPVEIRLTTTAPATLKVHAPSKERVSHDPYQDDPRIGVPFNGSSPSGDVEADVVYANFGRPEDFAKLKDLGIDVRGKIVLVRYGDNFPWREVVRCREGWSRRSHHLLRPDRRRLFPRRCLSQGPVPPRYCRPAWLDRIYVRVSGRRHRLPALPPFRRFRRISERLPTSLRRCRRFQRRRFLTATPGRFSKTLQARRLRASGKAACRSRITLGPARYAFTLVLKMEYQYRSIWNVIGVARGEENFRRSGCMLGNHRDAWVYGAVDPNSGTAALLKTVHGIGALLKSGWKPKRTLVFASWDGEEEGLVGSTEFVEQYANELSKAVAYFNMDAAVSGANFGASAVPSLKRFVRDVAKAVPSPKGGTVYDNMACDCRLLPTKYAAKSRYRNIQRSQGECPGLEGRCPRRRPRQWLRLHRVSATPRRALN